MAAFKGTPCEPDLADRPLPFRSRESMNKQMDRSSSWASVKKGNDSPSQTYAGKNGFSYKNANKENVRSWLDSTCPAPAYSSTVMDQRNVDLPPPSPSPVCSPSAASTPFSSPYVSSEQVQQHRRLSPSIGENARSSDNRVHPQTRFGGRNLEGLPSATKRNGKDHFNELPPASPTGSTLSSGSEGGLLALLASKLLSYKENGRRSSRYARESSGPIDEKHIVEDRSRKPPVDDIVSATSDQVNLRPQDSDMDTLGRNSSLYRTASEAVSELSLGSANGRTLSMEFDAMLAAAVATGIHQATMSDDQHLQHLPEIQEDVSSFGRMGSIRGEHADARALVRIGDEQQQMMSDDDAGMLTRALTVMRQGRDSEDMDFNSTLLDASASSRSSLSHGSRRGESEINNLQIVPTTVGVHSEAAGVNIVSFARNRDSSLESSSCGSNGENRLAMVLATTTALSPGDCSSSSPNSSSSQSKENTMMSIVPIPASQALEKVRRAKINAQAIAYQDAKSSKCSNRYKREESKITAWENQQRIKASLRMKNAEMRLEQKRAKALERMQNEIARAHKTAEERKASAEAVRAAKTAKVLEDADNIRRTGKMPSTASLGCFPF